MKQNSRLSFWALIGAGFAIVLPLLLLGVVMEILYGMVAGWVRPVLEAMPGTIFQNEVVRFVAVVGVVVLLFIMVGVLAGTWLGRSLGHRIERSLHSVFARVSQPREREPGDRRAGAPAGVKRIRACGTELSQPLGARFGSTAPGERRSSPGRACSTGRRRRGWYMKRAFVFEK